MEPVVKFVEAKRIVGMEAKFISARSPDHNNNQVIPALWGRYAPRSGEIMNRLSPADMGVISCMKNDSDQSHPDEMFYLAGAEVSDGSSNHQAIPEGMVSIVIPAGSYAVFTHKGSLDKIGFTMNYIYGSWLLKSDYKLRDAPEFEIYDHRFNPSSESSEFNIYIPMG